MTPDFLKTEIKFLKGVGPQRAEALVKELRIFSLDDLLHLFPFRYVDRTQFYRINEITAEMPFVQLRGKILRTESVGEGRSKRFVAYFSDSENVVELVWFRGAKWLQSKFKNDIEYIVFGKPTEFKGRFNIPHPDIEAASDDKIGRAHV